MEKFFKIVKMTKACFLSRTKASLLKDYSEVHFRKALYMLRTRSNEAEM